MTHTRDHTTRRPARLPANGRVLIRGSEVTGWTVNWSGRGACVLFEGELPDTDRLHLGFPDRYTWGEGEVIWTQRFPDGCLVGLRFVRLERRARRELDQGG